MNNRVVKISEIWLKASILGASWAASEIILGSFLHNIHMPFKGNILTGIGLILMISVSYKWKDKGLFWRTGLICALMKTMSPSAVIFGPMVAIFIESLLLEISVRLLGRNVFGFLLGAVLAMSWILFQKIANYIIFYGMNIVEIYDSLLKYAETQLNINTPLFWLPILILLGIYLIFGIVSVIIGLNIASDISRNPNTEVYTVKHVKPSKSSKDMEFPYSVQWLIFDVLLMVGNLVLIANFSLFIWMPSTIIIVGIWTMRYKRAMRQISRPKFWIFFVIITLLSALLLSSFTETEDKIITGLLIGLQMNFRAAIVILGFTVISKELYSPIIRDFFAKSAFKQLSPSLELAFDTLPYVISNIPSAKIFIKNPAEIVKLLVYHAEDRFKILSEKHLKKVFIVCGSVAVGKTSFIKILVKDLQNNHFNIGGFYSPRVMGENETYGYDIVDVQTNNGHPFLRKASERNADIGKFTINKSSYKIGRKLLSIDKLKNVDIVIIDEIGMLELKNSGWNKEFTELLNLGSHKLIISVRDKYLDDVLKKFNITNYLVFDAVDDNPSSLINKL